MLRLSIKSKMVLLVLVVLLPLSATGIIYLRNDLNENIAEEKNKSEVFVRSMISFFEKYIEKLWMRESEIGNFFASHDIDTDNIRNYLSNANMVQDGLTALSWISPDGSILASQAPGLTGISVADSEFFTRILSGEDKVVTDLVRSIADERQVIIVARRIEREDELYGILSGHIDPELFSHYIPDMAGASQWQFSFIDKNGNSFYRSDSADMPSGDLSGHMASIDEMGVTGTVDVADDPVPGSAAVMNIEYPAGIGGWKFTVSNNVDSVMEKHMVRIKYCIAILFTTSVFAVVLALLAAKKTLEPLASIKKAVSNIKNGDYSARANIYGNDELAVIAQSIDNMIDSLHDHDRMKSQFFADLSHELKTPLNVIFASTQLMESLDPGICECKNHQKIIKQVRSIKQNCYRLIRLVSNLLDVSKYDSGYLPINMDNYNIISILEDITMSVANYAENKGIRLVFDTDAEERYMACDPYIIERVMLNLLSNALKFTDKGGSIFVGISNKMDRVIIKVTDTGIGIPHDKLNHIFDRYKQVESSLEKNRYGSGIGLSLVKSLVEAHSGSIYVSSEPDKGTSFIIHMPAAVLPAPLSDDKKAKGSCKDYKSLTERIDIELSDVFDSS